jgi:5'-3' exonuclease
MTQYRSIALVDISYLFKRNYMAAVNGSSPGAAAQKTLDNLASIRESADHVVVCCDAPPYKRKLVFADYKALREKPEEAELAQKRWVMTRLKEQGYQIAKSPGYEADDIIATLARVYGESCPEVRLIASDKDIAQCVTDNVIQHIPPTGERKWERRDVLGVKAKFGVYPHEMPLWQALAGDSTDNVPGVPGIGQKKAAQLVCEFKTLAGIAEALASGSKTGAMWKSLAEHWAELKLSLDLVTLDTHVPLDHTALLGKLPVKPMAVDNMNVDSMGSDSMSATASDSMPGFMPNTTPEPEPVKPEPPVAVTEAAAPPVQVVTEAEFDPISPPPNAPPRAPVPAPPLPKQDTGTVSNVTALVREPTNYGLVTDDLQPCDLRSAQLTSKWLFEGGLYPQFQNPCAVFSVIARGKEMGLKMTTSLASFHVVEGKPVASADLIRALAERDPKCEYFRKIHSDRESVTWETKHRDHPSPTTYTYTWQDAVDAGLSNRDIWKKRRIEMLSKTASSKLAREVYAGSTLGLYCPEEMEQEAA